ncbi:C25 family cysteine peptidase [Hymenobacter sp. DH14]|uniref:C25 family cysteine peptidase n=1 Tax=Hymenobacter cyanobacteriorum TaxID=2926463 RepID=A0A9X1VDM0_9BACT|nr:C25 family cysteine peptidase [Hymenobacter cyanobacteriorum]MCI1186183.1 C25 family cysteine peptidase [Hymenobacter cyanobacteriorum]
MNNTTNYSPFRRCWPLLALCWLLLAGGVVRAQSGPVGNEWIVPGQQYYKIKVIRDGLHKLDYQYLQKAGISGVAPSEFQVWRRGQQMAIYVGGNQNVLDASTFIEFYGRANDAALDTELYKNPSDQAHTYFSLYSDTASYFLTWHTGTAGRRMQAPASAGTTPHPYRLLNKLDQRINIFRDVPAEESVYLPWIEPAEGFFMGSTHTELAYTIDSVSVSPTTAATTLPQVEVSLFGAPDQSVRYGGIGVAHHVEVVVVPASGPERVLGVMNFVGLTRSRQKFAFQPSDITAAGRLTIKLRNQAPVAADDYFYAVYLRTSTPQANTWYSNRHRIAFTNDSLLAGPATYELAGVPATVVGFDVQDLYNQQRVVSTPGTGAGLSRFVFPGANGVKHQLLLVDELFPFTPFPAQKIRFQQINPATPTFVIISHPQLMKPTAGTANAVKAYAAYRASAAGGRYDTLVVTSQQLYDQFTYGEKSWLALRHFARWVAAAGPAGRERYLLLLGKGVVPSEPVSSAYFAHYGEYGVDLVPTSSRSVSDNLITADYATDDYVAKLHTGRLTATTPQQIMNYLNKVITHDALGPAPWRKNVLHLVGGKDATEAQDFRRYLDKAKASIERPFLGGTVTTESRTGILPVSVDISAQLNAGLSVIDYFGHGSSNTFSLDFGAPSKVPSYNNVGKYPVLILNGCAGNGTYTQAYTVVEDYLFADQKGAIGSLGESGLSFPAPLGVALDTLHHLLFNDPRWYGKPVTAVHDEVVRRLQHTPVFRNNIGIEQLLSTSWQGDPTIALYSPALPDLVANSATLSIVPSAGAGQVTAASTNFVLNVGVSNPGKITYDPVEIRVTRTLGTQSMTYPFTVRQAWRQDTTYALTIPNSTVFLGKGGSNTFKVELDYANKIAESNETNNAAQINFTFLTGGLSVLNPTEFSISATTTPRLSVQSNNPLESSRGYEFELDTDPAFGTVKQRATITAGVLAEWQVAALPTTVAGRDSVVWYWRARFQTPTAGEDGSWVTSSFRVIPNSPTGWSQSDAGQFRRDALTGVAVSGPPTDWTFAPERFPLVLRTVGGGPPRSAAQFGNLLGGGIYLQSGGGVPSVSDCGVLSPNLLIAVYDGATLRPLVMPATYQRCGQAPNYFYYFSKTAPTSTTDTLDNLNYSAARQQQLDAFLTAIPNKAYVAVISTNRLRYSLLPAALKTRLQTLLGSQLITTLADGEPLAVVSQKLTATTGRLLHEKGPDRTSATLAYNQRIELTDTLQRAVTAGHVVSTLIGPSQQWNNLYASIRTRNNSGQYTLKVIGVNSQGVENTLFTNLPVLRDGTLFTQSLSTVSATDYRYLRLDLTLADTARVAPQLRQWMVTSRGLPEGIVQRDAVPASTYAAATLLQQATTSPGIVSFPVKFKNISTETFNGPLNTRVQVRDSNNNIRFTAPLISTAAPLPGETATINASIDMKGLFGRFQIEVVVNPQLQNPGLQLEQNYANNELILPEFTIINNNVPPTLDVAVDGRHILNGELVSARPVIVIQLNDEDQLRHITDASVFTLTLLRPGQTGLGTLVPLTGSDVHFTVDTSKGSVARLTYEPGLNNPLPDGKYTLRVQGRDPNNSAAAAQDVQLSFEVVNAATISNVYPYPNPVISKARFVFTVTGQELPRNMKIQIMSLTGRVVREIFMNELGPLHIGNNITDYAWDGTDSYGDRLANGTYLYRVAYDDSNVSFSHRETAGDKAFKNDWGKLVLMH